MEMYSFDFRAFFWTILWFVVWLFTGYRSFSSAENAAPKNSPTAVKEAGLLQSTVLQNQFPADNSFATFSGAVNDRHPQ